MSERKLKQLCFVLILIPLTMSIRCPTMSNELFCEEREIRKTNSTNCLISNTTINWHYEANGNGVVEAEFDMGSICNEYNIVLSVRKEVVTSQEECEMFSKLSDGWKKHSEYKYKSLFSKNNLDSVPLCNKTAKILFNYIYTGCYKLNIGSKYDNRIEDNNEVRPGTKIEQVKFLSTNHIHQNLTSILAEPTFTPQYRRNDNTTMITGILNKIIIENKHHIHLDFCLDNTNNNHIIEWETCCHFEKDKTKLEVCQTNDDMNRTSCDMKYDGENGIATCKVRDIPYGNYTLTVAFRGDPIRCLRGSIWREETAKDPCYWDLNQNIILEPEPTASLGKERNGDEISLAMCIVIAIFLGLLMLVITLTILKYKRRIKWFLIRRRHQKSTAVKAEQGEMHLITRHKIFLLYARDNEQFMDVMKNLKEVLKMFGGLEVHDIYDSDEQASIAPNKIQWIQEKLQEDRYKIVLVQSACGHLQTEQLVPVPSVYREPRYYDNLFSLAVDMLKTIVGPSAYNRLFVVQMAFDQRDYESFRFFNTYTRFGLPDRLHTLLTDLTNNQIDSSMVENSIEFEKFVNSYEAWRQFLIRNPNYLNDLLNVVE